MEMENKNYLEKVTQSIKASVTLKLITIFILMLLLLIPVSYVQSLIKEREDLRLKAIAEVSSKWSNAQYVYGPVLSIPIHKKIIDDDNVRIVEDYAHILPSQLNLQGKVVPKKLNRGIYEIVVYESLLSFSGHFDGINEYLSELGEYEVFPEDAFLSIHISDLRGIKERVVLNWNGKPKETEPGTYIPALIPSGITVKNIPDAGNSEKQNFAFDLHLQGSSHLGFVPLGKETRVVLESEWKDPAFSGAFLPDERSVNEEGFAAEWKVLELNRNYPQFWTGSRNFDQLKNAAFGVDFLLPVNDYQKSMRSAKYALLAISLTFLTFFLVEIFNKTKVHPFQYILIGLALVLFYTLLISISEQLNFDVAYLISSLTIIAIIAMYAKTILGSIRKTCILVLILLFTYGFVYATLQMQDYALLIGSIGLTVILAFTMYITRKINWYEVNTLKTGTLKTG